MFSPYLLYGAMAGGLGSLMPFAFIYCVMIGIGIWMLIYGRQLKRDAGRGT